MPSKWHEDFGSVCLLIKCHHWSAMVSGHLVIHRSIDLAVGQLFPMPLVLFSTSANVCEMLCLNFCWHIVCVSCLPFSFSSLTSLLCAYHIWMQLDSDENPQIHGQKIFKNDNFVGSSNSPMNLCSNSYPSVLIHHNSVCKMESYCEVHCAAERPGSELSTLEDMNVNTIPSQHVNPPLTVGDHRVSMARCILISLYRKLHPHWRVDSRIHDIISSKVRSLDVKVQHKLCAPLSMVTMLCAYLSTSVCCCFTCRHVYEMYRCCFADCDFFHFFRTSNISLSKTVDCIA